MTAAKSASSVLSSRGSTTCRGCHSDTLISVLDLGEQPLANELLPTAESVDDLFPLHLRVCPSCGLGQVGEYASRERIFRDYRYLSSVSTSWLAHAERYAEVMQRQLGLDSESLVVEVASNDGYLLQKFQKRGIPVLGVEPAENVAEIAQSVGIETLPVFLGVESAQALIARYGYPRLIVANNVMAHVPDLDDFVGGLAILCGGESVITIENPSFVTLLNEVQFDTIYHEHFSYLSAHAVQIAVRRHGLELVRVEELSTHGGSYRYWVTRAANQRDESVDKAIEREVTAGLLDPKLWNEFARRSHATIDGLATWVRERLAENCRIAAYGAAAKGNTLLNAARISAAELLVVADASLEKQGWFLPLSHVPIVAPAELSSARPTEVLVLPWNIAPEILPIVHGLCPLARQWVAVPAMTELGA